MGGRIYALLATTALVAVGCTGDDAAVSGPAGLVFDTPVNVMSADADANTVRVANDAATVELTDLTFDAEGGIDTFGITLGLPDGTSVSFNETDMFPPGEEEIGPWWGVLLAGENPNWDRVEILIGAGFDNPENYEELFNSALFALARVDPYTDEPDFGFDTYMVSGDVTDTLPEGEGYYYGDTIASGYAEGALLGDAYGIVEVAAGFTDGTVDIYMNGDGAAWGYELIGFDLSVDGSSYGGDIDGIAGYEGCACEISMSGDLLGAFFGDNAEATAGVFGVDETDFEAEGGADMEIVGGFAAYRVD